MRLRNSSRSAPRPGIRPVLLALVCESLSRRSAHSSCAHRCTCDVCSCSGGRCRSRDAAEASSRSRCRARAETRAPFELDRVHAATCHIQDSCSEPSPHGVPALRRRASSNGTAQLRRSIPPARVAELRCNAVRAQCGRPSQSLRKVRCTKRACRIRIATYTCSSRCSMPRSMRHATPRTTHDDHLQATCAVQPAHRA
jgi:hypothetical protein